MLKPVFPLLFFLIASAAPASPVETAMKDPQVRGAATFRFLGLPIYEARLFTEAGKDLNPEAPHALELTYRRPAAEARIVKETLGQLRRLGFPTPDPLRKALDDCFADAGNGDRFLAIPRGPDRIDFWFNERPTCTLQHPGIRKGFMGIFLGDNSQSASFTRALKGS